MRGQGSLPFDFNKMLKQFKDIPSKVSKLKEVLRDRIVEASAGGGVVNVKFNGALEMVDIKISPEVMNPDDKEMLEELIIAAINECIAKSKNLIEDEFAKQTGLPLPRDVPFF